MTKVRVRGVKVYRSKGILYAYHRATGIRLTPPHTVGSPEWFAALEAAQAKVATKPKERVGTWGGIVTAYRASPRFLGLAMRTREDYHGILDYLKPLHGMPLEDFTRGFFFRLRDKAQLARGRRFANYLQSVVSVVFEFSIERSEDDAPMLNPIARLKKIRRPKDQPRANRPWAPEEWQAVIEAAPPRLLAPILLAGVLGYRQGEALTCRRDSWNSRTGMLTRLSAKSGKVVTIPAPAEVARALEALPRHDATTLLVSTRGVPWSADGFRSSFFKLIRQLEKDGKVASGLTFHGLRHTAATRVRQLGFDTRTIADMLGQETEGMAAHYSREADLEPKLRGVVRKIDFEAARKVGRKR